MGLLAINISSEQTKTLLAVSMFTVQERENIGESAILFFDFLRRKAGSIKSFLDKVESLLSLCGHEDVLSMVAKYKESNKDLLSEPVFHAVPAESLTAVLMPSQHVQKQLSSFRAVLFKISLHIPSKELGIMVVICPIPASSKEKISDGLALFEKMERYGCIDENNTDLLQEMLELLRLSRPLKLLNGYRWNFGQITIHHPQLREVAQSPRMEVIQYFSSSSQTACQDLSYSISSQPGCIWSFGRYCLNRVVSLFSTTTHPPHARHSAGVVTPTDQPSFTVRKRPQNHDQCDYVPETTPPTKRKCTADPKSYLGY